MSKILKLRKGDIRIVIQPEIHISGTGKNTYLWIGDDSPVSHINCFGTKSGAKTLEKFAKEILKSLKVK